MASSGSKSYSFTNWDSLVFNWSISSKSVENNTSTVAWNVQLVSGSSGRIDSSVSKYIQAIVNGKTYSGNVSVAISNNATKTLLSGSTVISHNADGTKTFDFEVGLMLNITFSGNSIGTVSFTGSGTLDTIPRFSTISVTSGYLGQAQTITVTRHNSSFKHRITYKCGSLSGTVCSGTDSNSSATSISFTPPLSLAAANTTGQSVNVTYTIATINGNVTYATTKSTTVTHSMRAADFAPSVSISVSDPTGNLTKYGNYVKELSKFGVTVTATPKQSASISSYSTTGSGIGTYTTASFTTGLLGSSGTPNITATVKDSRGFSGTATVSVNVLDYAPPSISKLTVKRCNSDGTEYDQGEYVKVTFSAAVTSLNSKNTAIYALEHKKSADTDYTPISFSSLDNTYSVTDISYIFEAATDSSYDVKVIVTDNHSSAIRTTSASTAFTLIHYRADGTGIAFGKISENANTFDFGLQMRNSGGLMNEVLDKYNDLNDVMIPNTYVSINQGASYYSNCPITSGTFVLEVMSAGAEGQLLQRLTTTFKDGAHQIFIRHYYQSSWGRWICVQNNATPWVSLTLASGISHGSEMKHLNAKLVNGVLYIEGDVTGISANWTHFATIPDSIYNLIKIGYPIRFVGVYNVSYFASLVLQSGQLFVAGNSSGTWDATKNFSINVAIPLPNK